jgi:hypothetical protein
MTNYHDKWYSNTNDAHYLIFLKLSIWQMNNDINSISSIISPWNYLKIYLYGQMNVTISSIYNVIQILSLINYNVANYQFFKL